jgi:hypothetical protein
VRTSALAAVQFDSQGPPPPLAAFDAPTTGGSAAARKAKAQEVRSAAHSVQAEEAVPEAQAVEIERMVRKIASRFQLQLFGIDVAVTASGDCLVLDFNHLPRGVAGPGLVDAMVDVVMQREASRSTTKRRRTVNSRATAAHHVVDGAYQVAICAQNDWRPAGPGLLEREAYHSEAQEGR